jgi:hypothetical protein
MAAIAIFVGIVTGIVVSVFLLAFFVARLLGGSLAKGAWRAVDLLVWVVIVLQTLAEAGRAASPGLPSGIANVFSLLAFTQLEGVGAPPACWELYPFAGDVIAMVFALLLTTPLAVAAFFHGPNGKPKWERLVALPSRLIKHCTRQDRQILSSPEGANESSNSQESPSHSRWGRLCSVRNERTAARMTFLAEQFRRRWPVIATSASVLLYGPVANSVFRLLYCRQTQLTLAEVEALAGGSTNSGSLNPDGTITLPLLAYYPSFVCWQGDHKPAGTLAIFSLILFTLGFPLWTFVWLRSSINRTMKTTFRPAHLGWLLGDATSGAAVLTRPDAVSYVFLSGALPSLAQAGAILALKNGDKKEDEGLPPGVFPTVAIQGRLESLPPAECWELVLKADQAGIAGLKKRYPTTTTPCLPFFGRERTVAVLSEDSRKQAKRTNSGKRAAMTTSSSTCGKENVLRWLGNLARAVFCGVTVKQDSGEKKALRRVSSATVVEDSLAKSKGTRRRAIADRVAGDENSFTAPLPLPGSLVPALIDSSAALADDILLAPWVDSSQRASGVFMRHVDMLCLGVLAALQNLWPRPETADEAGGRGTLIVLTLLLTAFFAGTRSPFPYADSWKLSAKVGCLLLGALSAILTHVTLGLQVSSGAPTKLSNGALSDHPTVNALSVLVGIGCVALLLTIAFGFIRSVVRGPKVERITASITASRNAAQAAWSSAGAAFASAAERMRQLAASKKAVAGDKGDKGEDDLPPGYDGGRRFVRPLADLANSKEGDNISDRRVRAVAAAGGATTNPLRGAMAGEGRASFAASPLEVTTARKIVVPGQIVEPPGLPAPAAPWLKDGLGLPTDGGEETTGADGQRIFVSPLPGLAESLRLFEEEAREAGAQVAVTAKGEDFAYSFSLGGAAAAARRGASGGGV